MQPMQPTHFSLLPQLDAPRSLVTYVHHRIKRQAKTSPFGPAAGGHRCARLLDGSGRA